MREVNTNFPNEVDNRIFYNDINIEQLEDIINDYKIKLDASDYNGASVLLQENEVDLDYPGAWLWNLLELRIEATQEYLLDKQKPQLQIYSSTAPTGAQSGMVWVSEYKFE